MRSSAGNAVSAHIVHLAVAGAGIAARAVDLLHDDGGLGQAEARAAILFGDQRCEPARLGECVDKRLRVAALLVDATMVLRREFGAERAHGIADVLVIIPVWHGISLVSLRRTQAHADADYHPFAFNAKRAARTPDRRRASPAAAHRRGRSRQDRTRAALPHEAPHPSVTLSRPSILSLIPTRISCDLRLE